MTVLCDWKVVILGVHKIILGNLSWSIKVMCLAV